MSPDDHRITNILVEVGAIQRIRPIDLPKGGHIIIACPDGDTTPELLEYCHFSLFPKANDGERVCTHQVPVGGGPLAIPKESPLNAVTFQGRHIGSADEIVFAGIELGLRAKGNRLRNITLVPHCACAAATMNRLTLWENFRLTFLAKDMIRKEFPNVFDNIKVMPHIHFLGHPKGENSTRLPFRSYILRREAFEKAFDLNAYNELCAV